MENKLGPDANLVGSNAGRDCKNENINQDRKSRVKECSIPFRQLKGDDQ